ncbi:MAG TPA: D-glycerate dehydrogenase [Gemmatimonadales bacterium]|nr:D-glycerate dehydrogenase [Gemmatimonadales bacterium]
MSQHQVTVTRRLPAPIEAQLGQRYRAVLNPDDAPFSPKALRAALTGSDAVVVTVTDRIDAAMLQDCRARIIANYGVGLDHIDLAAAAKAGIVVINTPGALTDATAELAFTLMLMTARRAGEGERLVRSGKWTGWAPTQLVGRSLDGATLGIVGMGRIGRATAVRAARGCGMKIMYWSRSALADGLMGGVPVERVESLDDLLQRADVVSLHTPATPETHHLIDARRLALLRPNAILINTARGPVVDEAALVDALERGRLMAAGLDVYEREPTVHPGLLQLEQAVLLPHLGSATETARIAMGNTVLCNLEAFFAGKAPPDRVTS